MSEIRPTSSIQNWPSNRVVNPNQSKNHSSDEQHKNQHEAEDEELEAELNPKKRHPNTGMNSHIDEYV